jgi:hypothetical protein
MMAAPVPNENAAKETAMGHTSARKPAREGPGSFSERLGLFYSAPLGAVPLLVIAALSLAQTVLVTRALGPLAVLAYVVIGIVGLRYGLNLLLKFSQGRFDLGAVVVQEERSPYTVYKVIGAVLLVGVEAALLSLAMPPLAWVFGVLVMVCLPAIVMLTCVTDSMASGLHVGKWLCTMAVAGGSYGWLLAMSFLVFVGSGALGGFLQGFIGGGFVARLGQALVSNYALFVVCCMMGYVLFEKAERFDIETHEQQRARLLPGAAAAAAQVASVQDLLSQGDVEAALELAAEEARVAIGDARVQERYFKLLQMQAGAKGEGQGDDPRLLPQATRWLKACAGSRRADDCARLVTQWWTRHPAMLDDAPQAFLDAARLAAQGGAAQEALQMLQHFRQVQRGSMLMPAAVLLEAEILFSRLREPLQARERLQELLRLFPQSQPQVNEATAMLKVIEAAQQRPVAAGTAGAAAPGRREEQADR